MMELLPAGPPLAAFIAASLILAVTPGPGVFYIVSRSLLEGRSHGLASVAGIAVGNLGNAFGASIGLSALLAVSATAFTLLKFAGALYLVYLGVRALLSARSEFTATQPDASSLWLTFRDGGLVALLNPKTAIFFAAFLPQFMDNHADPILQAMLLGTLFVAIAALTDSVYALAAGSVAPALTRARGIGAVARYFKGAAFVGLGIFTALADMRHK